MKERRQSSVALTNIHYDFPVNSCSNTTVTAIPFTLMPTVEIDDQTILTHSLSGGARGGKDAIAGYLLRHERCYNWHKALTF